jgi:hypothetical protein
MPLRTSSEWTAPYLENGMSLDALPNFVMGDLLLNFILSGLYSIGPGDVCLPLVSNPLLFLGTENFDGDLVKDWQT